MSKTTHVLLRVYVIQGEKQGASHSGLSKNDELNRC
jgi:hypothetical protein